MPEPESVRQAFERTEPPLGDVARYVRDTLDQYCRDRKYLFSERTKTSESLAEKLESGRFHRWSKLDDLYACTVVVPVQDHEDRVIRHLDAVFDRKTIRNRDATSKAPDVFRFDGTRWYGTIPSTAAAERQPGADEIVFEVQVVTAFEYAWMAVTHDLVYKADEVDWRQLRLAAQLKAAVEQVEVLIAAFDSASSVVRESPWSETTSKSAIVTRFKTLADDGHIPATLEPSSWRRFADNVFSLVSSYTPDRRKVEEAVQSLLDKVETELRTPNGFSLPNSGTLFSSWFTWLRRTGVGATSSLLSLSHPESCETSTRSATYQSPSGSTASPVNRVTRRPRMRSSLRPQPRRKLGRSRAGNSAKPSRTSHDQQARLPRNHAANEHS